MSSALAGLLKCAQTEYPLLAVTLINMCPDNGGVNGYESFAAAVCAELAMASSELEVKYSSSQRMVSHRLRLPVRRRSVRV